MESNFGLSAKPQMTKFTFGKSLMAQTTRIKEMRNQEFEHDQSQEPIKQFANGFTIRTTAVISPKTPNCNQSTLASATLRKKKFQRVANSIRFMNKMKGMFPPRAQSSNNVGDLQRTRTLLSRDNSPLSQVNRNTLTRDDNFQRPIKLAKESPRSNTNQKLRVKKIKTIDLFSNFQKSKEIAIKSQMSQRSKDSRDRSDTYSKRAPRTALSGLKTRIKLQNNVGIDNIDLIKDEINYDRNCRPMSIERPSYQKEVMRYATPINKTSRPFPKFPNEAELIDSTQLPSIKNRQERVQNDLDNLSQHTHAKVMTSLSMARHHKNMSRLSPFMAANPKHFGAQNQMFYKLKSKQIAPDSLGGSDLESVKIYRPQTKQTFVRSDKKSVVPIVISRNKIDFESNRMMDLRKRMATPEIGLQQTQILQEDSKESEESPGFGRNLQQQDLSIQMNKIELRHKSNGRNDMNLLTVKY